jgi:hypothetical protein
MIGWLEHNDFLAGPEQKNWLAVEQIDRQAETEMTGCRSSAWLASWQKNTMMDWPIQNCQLAGTGLHDWPSAEQNDLLAGTS